MRIIIATTIIAVIILSGCVKPLAIDEKGDISASRKVLIAGHRSEFKDSIVTGIIEKLHGSDVYVKVIGMEALSREKTENYNAVLLVTVYRAARINKKVRKFLRNASKDPRVIVFYTYGRQPSEKFMPQIEVDTVSSASVTSEIPNRTDELLRLIEKRF